LPINQKGVPRKRAIAVKTSKVEVWRRNDGVRRPIIPSPGWNVSPQTSAIAFRRRNIAAKTCKLSSFTRNVQYKTRKAPCKRSNVPCLKWRGVLPKYPPPLRKYPPWASFNEHFTSVIGCSSKVEPCFNKFRNKGMF